MVLFKAPTTSAHTVTPNDDDWIVRPCDYNFTVSSGMNIHNYSVAVALQSIHCVNPVIFKITRVCNVPISTLLGRNTVT